MAVKIVAMKTNRISMIGIIDIVFYNMLFRYHVCVQTNRKTYLMKRGVQCGYIIHFTISYCGLYIWTIWKRYHKRGGPLWVAAFCCCYCLLSKLPGNIPSLGTVSKNKPLLFVSRPFAFLNLTRAVKLAE